MQTRLFGVGGTEGGSIYSQGAKKNKLVAPKQSFLEPLLQKRRNFCISFAVSNLGGFIFNERGARIKWNSVNSRLLITQCLQVLFKYQINTILPFDEL